MILLLNDENGSRVLISDWTVVESRDKAVAIVVHGKNSSYFVKMPFSAFRTAVEHGTGVLDLRGFQ